MSQSVSSAQWCLEYGWHIPDPTGRTLLSKRQGWTHKSYFESLEASISHSPPGSWWEIRDPAGGLVFSSHSGFDEKACPNPSLCARQILNSRSAGWFPDAAMDVVQPNHDRDQVSHDDGETWARILLGKKGDGSPKPSAIKPPAPLPLENLILVAGPEALGPKEDTIEIRYGGEIDTQMPALIYTINNPVPKRKPVGHAVVRKGRLAVKKRKSGGYDLIIRKPDEKRARVYAPDIDQSVIDSARNLGIVFEEPEEIKAKGREVLERFGIKVGKPAPDKVDKQEEERAKMFAVPEEAKLDQDPVHITGTTAVNGPVINPERRFYVSVVDGQSKPRYGFLIGPFKLHQTALSIVDEVSRLVQERYPWSHFYQFGTCSLPKESAFKVFGVLNDEEELREIYRRAFLAENRIPEVDR